MGELPDVSFNADVIAEFRANDGKVGGPWEHATLLLLHTAGAKSGEPRVNPLGCFDVEDKLLIAGTYGGADINPAWVHNLRANPRARIDIGTQTIDVEARELPPGERDEAWIRLAELAPVFTQYQSKTTRTIPIFEVKRT